MSHVVIADSIDDFVRIHEPGVNLVILKREVDPVIRSFFEGFGRKYAKHSGKNGYKHFDVGWPVDQKDYKYGHFFESMREMEGFEESMEDMAYLTRCLDSVKREERLFTDLNMDQINTARAFHLDTLSLRLFCAYTKSGPEYLRNGNVNRKAVNERDKCSIARDYSKIKRILPFWVAIWKGKYYPGIESNELIHRAPYFRKGSKPRVTFRGETLPS